MADEEGEIVTTEVEGVVLKTMKAKLQHLEEEGKEPYTIYRVLPSVRDGHSEDYDPKIISIGPLHAGKKIGSLASGSFFWLLSSFVYCRPPLKCLEFHDSADEERLRAPRMIPTATELEESGVEFKRKKANSSLDITFRDGVMEIPLLSVGDNTAPKFRNLIAFEQCCPTPGSHFTSYASFLDNLISTPRDVAILRKCGIIENKLGQDEEVADLFNSLCKGTYLHYERQFFANLFKDVNQYCEVDRHRSRARLVHDYFGTPWSTISVIAAIFLLILTVTQTFFAVYAYYQPPEQS